MQKSENVHKKGNANLPAMSMTVNRSSGPLPARPDPRPIDVEQVRDGNQCGSHETQRASRPIDAHLAEHDAGEQREAAGEQTP